MSSEGGDHKLTFTVLGATGGCSLAFLVRALQAGHNCSACESFFIDFVSKKRKKKNLLNALFVICVFFFFSSILSPTPLKTN